MNTFADLQFKQKDEPGLGVQAREDYQNGYGVSVVRGRYTYGGDQGLYELAVMHFGELCYLSPVTSDVIGYLTPEQVTLRMAEVQALPPNPTCEHAEGFALRWRKDRKGALEELAVWTKEIEDATGRTS